MFFRSLACFFTRATRLSLLLVRVVLFNTSWFNKSFLLVVAAAKLLKYPSRVLESPLAPSCWVSRGSWSSGRAAELAAPNLSAIRQIG